MGRRLSSWILRLWALIWKDLVDEFRTRYAVNALVMFALTTLVMVSFAVGIYPLSPGLHAVFIWIIIFFSALSGVGRAFVKEEEKGTAPALRLSAPPELIYIGKLLFNFLLVGILAVVVLPFYFVMMAPPLGNVALIMLTLFLCVFCLASVTTILAAIVSRAGSKNALLPILSFPMLLPALISAVNATEVAMEGGTSVEACQDLQFLLSYGVIITASSLLLFNFVWND